MDQQLDTGTAYGRQAPTHDAILTEVGPGTPMGELMRRYWHPIALSQDATTTPKQVRVLGEDLILFRDKQGRPGLLYPRCAHRGTSLYFGKVEDDGIRCCYHGWKFSADGHCLDQPCEPERGAAHRNRIRQPWYPVQERYGLIFAYMGPAHKKPVLTKYEPIEVLADDEEIFARQIGFGAGGPAIVPCNWLQYFENVCDPYHVPILHVAFSGPQFPEELGVMPDVSWDYTERGVKITSSRDAENNKRFDRVSETIIPTIRVIPDPFLGEFGRIQSVGWTLPIDDTHFTVFVAQRRKKDPSKNPPRRPQGRRWDDLTPEERRETPNDWEAQVSQGPINLHSEEHLASTDRGIGRLRRLLRLQIKSLENGEDPMNVFFDESKSVLPLEAGNHLNDK
jgi:phenylpropionate dioxygenase-like ring-hydroxylating dioxygenase large terminal subunit